MNKYVEEYLFTIVWVSILYVAIYILLTIGINVMLPWIFVFITLFGSMLYLVISKCNTKDYSPLIVVPIIITSFQNVFLAVNIEKISKEQMPYLVIVNYVYGCILLLLLIVTKFRKINSNQKKMLFQAGILVLLSIVLYVIKPSSSTAFFSSFRNLTCPVFFTIIGMLVAEKIDFNSLLSFLFTLACILLAVGIYERFFNQNFWIDLSIGELWNKKGIYYNELTGKPYNHYSAETIAGKQMLRMVSSFAEPVNLGSYFVLVFLLAKWRDNKIMMWVSIVGCILTISKGALMSVILLYFVISFYKFSRKTFLVISSGITLLVVFFFFIINNAGGSMAIHIWGFLSAVENIIDNPIGSGVGNVGVYGFLLNVVSETEKTQIQESGLGVIIGQLGIAGLICYIYFFVLQYKMIHSNKYQLLTKDKILAYSLLFSFFLLITFSESALGPNTSAIYAMVIGIVCGKISQRGNIDGTQNVL